MTGIPEYIPSNLHTTIRSAPPSVYLPWSVTWAGFQVFLIMTLDRAGVARHQSLSCDQIAFLSGG